MEWFFLSNLATALRILLPRSPSLLSAITTIVCSTSIFPGLFGDNDVCNLYLFSLKKEYLSAGLFVFLDTNSAKSVENEWEYWSEFEIVWDIYDICREKFQVCRNIFSVLSPTKLHLEIENISSRPTIYILPCEYAQSYINEYLCHSSECLGKPPQWRVPNTLGEVPGTCIHPRVLRDTPHAWAKVPQPSGLWRTLHHMAIIR